MGKSIRYILWVLVLLLWGCDSQRLYEKNYAIPSGIWHSQHKLSFHFMVQDTVQAHHIFLNTRYETGYPYYNIYIAHSLSDIAGNELSKELAELHLFEAKGGRPLGKGSAELFFKEDTLLAGYRFRAPGRYTVQVHHSMRIDSLVGIRNIGIRVDKIPIQ